MSLSLIYPSRSPSSASPPPSPLLPLPLSASQGRCPARRGSGSRALRGTVAARDGAARRTSRRRQSRGDAASEVHGRLPGAACSSLPRGLPATTPAPAPYAPAPTAPGGDPEAPVEACSYLLGEMRRPLLLRPLDRPARVQAHRHVSPGSLLLPAADGWGSLSPLLSPSEQAPYERATGGSRGRRRVDLTTSAVEDGCGSEVRISNSGGAGDLRPWRPSTARVLFPADQSYHVILLSCSVVK
jgi:hypothetical protein